MLYNLEDETPKLYQKYPQIDRSLIAKVLDYANILTDTLNKHLSHPKEAGRLRIEMLRIARSDGSKPQLDERWHQDALRHLTAVTNLKGATTRYVLPGTTAPKGPPSEELIQSAENGKVMIFSGGVRNFLFRGPGTEPLYHAAPEGTKDERLGIILFWRLEPFTFRAAYEIQSSANKERLRRDMLEQLAH
jgi:hypothetical protein